jgi:hypothetical protein
MTVVSIERRDSERGSGKEQRTKGRCKTLAGRRRDLCL